MTVIDERVLDGLERLEGSGGLKRLEKLDTLENLQRSEGSGRAVTGCASRLARRVAAATRGEPREAGMATAEYAIATVAAAGFAGLLLAILRSDEVRSMLLGLVRGALSL